MGRFPRSVVFILLLFVVVTPAWASVFSAANDRLGIQVIDGKFTEEFGSTRAEDPSNRLLVLDVLLVNLVTPELVFDEDVPESMVLQLNKFQLLWDHRAIDAGSTVFTAQPGHLQDPVRLTYSGAKKHGHLVFEVPAQKATSLSLVFRDSDIGTLEISSLDSVLTTLVTEDAGESEEDAPSVPDTSAADAASDSDPSTVEASASISVGEGKIHVQVSYQDEQADQKIYGTAIPETADFIFLSLKSELDHPVESEVRWIAEKVEGVETGKHLHKQNQKLFAKGHRKSERLLRLKGRGGWQRLGDYRADIAIDGQVLQSVRFQVTTDVGAAPAQPSTGPPPGYNIALAVLGGRAEQVVRDGDDDLPTADEDWQPSNLIDDAPYFTTDPSKFQRCLRCGWKWPTKHLPVELVFSFHEKKTSLISTVIIDTRTIIKDSITVPKHVEVWLAKENTTAGFHKVASVRLARTAAQHMINFPPTRARFVKLRILSAHDYGSTKNLAVSEVAIIESPQQQPSIVEAVEKNIALARSGGGISRFSSHWLKEDGGVFQLIDGSDETPGWRTRLDQLPQEITFSFRENREAWIDFLAIRQSTQHDSATWPKRISIETSSISPVSDFRPIGEFVLPRAAAEWRTPIQSAARYVKLTILENYGGPYISLGEVRIVERETPNYRPVLFNGPRKTEELVASSLPQAVWPEREPNEVPAEATTVPLGESFGGIIENSSDRDLYSFAVPGDRRMALAVDLTGVPYLSTLIQLKNTGGEELRREEPQGHSTQNTSFAWNIDPGDYYLEVTRPPVSVVLLWDGSGSMAGQTENLRVAVRAYLNNLGDDNHVNVARFAGTDVVEFFDRFTNDPLKAWNTVKDEFTAKGGTPLYKAIEKGIELLEGRSGNKAVILMTDGVDSKKQLPVFWETVATSSVRFYTIGLGPDQDIFFLDRASNGKRLLADLSRASGGRHFVVHSSDQLSAIYERIGRELQSPTHYRLTLRQSEETGGLTVIANRDTASDEDTSTTSAGSKKDNGKKHPSVEEQPSGAAVHLEIIFDASGSMKIAVGGESKITAAKRALKEVLKSLDLDHIALAFRAYGFDTSIEYGKETTCKNTELLVGFDEGSPSSIIRAANPLQTYGHTPIAKSLRLAGEDLKPFKEEHPTILLISDGKDSCDGNPVAEIERLRARGIDAKVHIVGFDLDDAARSQLQHIANAGNGNYYDAKDYHDLSESLNRVAETITQVADSSLQEKNEDDSTIPPEKQAFDVLDDTGRRVAQGRVGDTITELVPGIYTVLVNGSNSVITIEKVHVDSGEITLVEL